MEKTDLAKQLAAATEGALFETEPGLGTLVVTGKDRKTWLNGLVTCDLAPLAAGQGAFGLHVAKNGKIQAELWIVLDADRALVGPPRDATEGLAQGLERYLIMEDAEVAVASDAFAWLLVHGPLAGGLVAVAREAGAIAAAAIDRFGTGGAAIVVEASKREGVIAALVAHAGERGAVATAEGLAQVRLELGLGTMGVDYDTTCYPQEASIERLAVSFNKGCYLGQETVYMLEVRGHVKAKLVQIALEGEGEIAKDTPIESPDGTALGRVTRGGARVATGEPLALGYVKYKHIAPGTALVVGGRAARVVK